MAKRFGKRRWRRPQRMTLEGPVGVRRKDIVVPEYVPLEPAEVRPANRGHTFLLLTLFVVVAAVEGGIVALLGAPIWIPAPFAALAGLYLLVARALGDKWMQGILRAQPVANPRTGNILAALAAQSGIRQPALLSSEGDAPNALALGLSRPWICVTSGTLSLGVIEQEAILAREIEHIRCGDARTAAWYVVVCGAAEIATKGIAVPGGLPALLSVPLWPAAIILRAAGRAFLPRDFVRRGDIGGALLTRYPPGMRSALRAAGVEQSDARLRATDALWTISRAPGAGPPLETRLEAVGEI